ncbi:MAG TPA: DMT family transporter [Jatrophihabitans sp.]|nr:DMT family transporter [Jatrophihabitans sp.]
MTSVGSNEALSFLCAAAAAGGNALANVMQRKASLEQREHKPFGPAVLADLVRRTTWIIGFSGMVASFVLQAIALRYGPLSAVETVITLEVPLTLLVASRVFRTSIGRTEWTGIWTMTAGMVVLIAALNPKPGNESNVSHGLYVVAGGGTVAFIVGLLIAAQRGGPIWRTACLGAAAGSTFGLTATLIKEVTAQLSAHGVIGVVTTWQTYAAAGLGITGVIIVQWALHTGPLLAAQPGFTLMDPLVSILWGVLVYNEMTRTGPWIPLAILGAAGIAGGVFMLARSPLLTSLNEHAIDAAEDTEAG